MCGIGAIVGAAGDTAAYSSQHVGSSDIDRVERAMTALAGRGPDGGRHEALPGALFLTTRLIQWDEGSPRQPYVTGHGDCAVFNGELFNLAALQTCVGLPGAPEIAVLLAGLRRWGPQFLTRVDGQFAVIVRFAEGTTYAARDRFGICPLFQGMDGQRQVFASSVAAVAALQGSRRPTYGVAGLAAILRDWAPTGTSTPYVGITQVPPGCVVVIDRPGAGRVDRWTSASAPSAAGSVGGPDAEDDALAGLEARLRAAVRVRMRSVGDVACLVSGGVDSTVVAAVAREEGARLGLSLWLDGDDVTRERQTEAAHAVGLKLIQHRLTAAETMGTFRSYVSTRRLPLVRLGPVGMTALARRARAEGVRAVLSGEGADEVFCGYDSYRLIAAQTGLFGPIDTLDWDRFGEPEIPVGRGTRAHRAYWRGLIALGARSPQRIAILRPVTDMFGPVLTAAMALAEAPLAEAQLAEAAPPVGASTPDAVELLRRRRHEDLATLLAGYLLVVQGDHAWLEEGVELRPPYLAAIVADWALARDPVDFLSVERGKLPVYGLLARLAERHPRLTELGFAKSAFRVDARLLLIDDDVYGDFRAAVSACPDELVVASALLERLDRARRAGTLSEAESMLGILAASFGILATT